MALATEVGDEIKQVFNVGHATFIDITCTGIAHATPIFKQGQKIFDVNVVIAIKIGITVLFFSKILFNPLDRGFVSFFTSTVVEHDPEWL